jgi:hypothetical protein
MIRAYTKSQTSCLRVLHKRLWRFPFKPPALLGVIGLLRKGFLTARKLCRARARRANFLNDWLILRY